MTFNSLVESNYKDLLTIANHITGCKEKAHDLMNDTYLHLVNKAVNVENQDEFVKFYRVCMRNLYLDSFKKKGIKIVDVIEIECVEVQTDLIDKLEVFKKSLPLHEIYLYELYFETGLSSVKIAELLNEDGYNISYRYIENFLLNIKKKLRAKEWM